MTTVKAEYGSNVFYVEVKPADVAAYLREVGEDVARDFSDRNELLATSSAAVRSLTTCTEQQARALARVLMWLATQDEDGGDNALQAIEAGGHTIHWIFEEGRASFLIYPTIKEPNAGLTPIQ
jgi:hypothetical protein